MTHSSPHKHLGTGTQTLALGVGCAAHTITTRMNFILQYNNNVITNVLIIIINNVYNTLLCTQHYTMYYTIPILSSISIVILSMCVLHTLLPHYLSTLV